MMIETGKADPGHSPTTQDIIAQIIVIHIETTLDHNTGKGTVTSEVAHDDLTYPTEDTATDLTMTLLTGHIADHHKHHEAPQVINSVITAGHIPMTTLQNFQT